MLTDTELTSVRSHLSDACTILDRYPDQVLAEDLIIRASIYLTLPRGDLIEQIIADIIGAAPDKQITRKINKCSAQLERVAS